jgi:hypothetical protein
MAQVHANTFQFFKSGDSQFQSSHMMVSNGAIAGMILKKWCEGKTGCNGRCWNASAQQNRIYAQ